MKFIEFPVIANQSSDWCGNPPRIPGSPSSSIRRSGHWPPAKTNRISALFHVKWNLFAERNTNIEAFLAGRSMSAPTEADDRHSKIRGRFPHQESGLVRNDAIFQQLTTFFDGFCLLQLLIRIDSWQLLCPYGTIFEIIAIVFAKIFYLNHPEWIP